MAGSNLFFSIAEGVRRPAADWSAMAVLASKTGWGWDPGSGSTAARVAGLEVEEGFLVCFRTAREKRFEGSATRRQTDPPDPRQRQAPAKNSRPTTVRRLVSRL